MRTGRSLTVSRSLLPGGVCLQGGLLWGGVSAPGGCLLLGGCLLPGGSALGAVCLQWGCLLLGGVSAPGGVCLGGVCSGGCLLSGCVCLPLGGCLLSGCVCLPLGGSASWGVSALGGVCFWGVSAPGGVWYPSMHWGRHPPCEQNDKQVQKYYLGHNFVAAGNNESFTVVFNIFKNNIWNWTGTFLSLLHVMCW